MDKTISQQKVFISLTVIWIIAASAGLLIEDKIYWQVLFNNNHSAIADWFFKYITWLGDGLLIVIASILLGFVRIRLAILSLSSYLISGLFAQLLKRFVFDHIHRPAYIFEQMGIDIVQVQDVALRTKHSFPSGHTTSAFAFFMAIALILAARKHGLQIVLFAMALLVGISRIYLNLHFLNDVLFGSILGIVTTLGIYQSMNNMQYKWLEKPYQNLIKKRM